MCFKVLSLENDSGHRLEDGICCKLFGNLARVTYITTDNLLVDLKLYSVNDFNNPRLVKSTIIIIFKLGLRRVVVNTSSDSYQGILGGD